MALYESILINIQFNSYFRDLNAIMVYIFKNIAFYTFILRDKQFNADF